MKNILILGSSGRLGLVLTKFLLDRDFFVVALVRNPEKIKINHKNLTVIKGNVFDYNDLLKALTNIEVVIPVLGHGFRTKFPIQVKTLTTLIPLMEKNKINRLITVTGANLIVKNDPFSVISSILEKFLYLVDPYRLSDSKKQQILIEQSRLDWTVVRTPIHNNKKNIDFVYIGYNQPPFWKTISRYAISNFIVDCIQKNKYVKKAPIIC